MINVLPDKTVFDSPAHTIVNTVNCVGVVGKGLALAVRTVIRKSSTDIWLHANPGR